ncbi:hypothetical protein DEA8626_00273 [Defluviimonas aquaemixtae]|uniref:DUF6647 domain-containing protein n=1 Tax=Albidovulum aquaemixtae TaxID=1542388 RepID=A0A2R8B2H4_9RHOB|nr:DUF6647 family protein [Defluviimonas aquaemixtae]SPH16762.1 hypothetical protein DEA8626_00273 [Defluviimonas aquaemixtae]
MHRPKGLTRHWLAAQFAVALIVALHAALPALARVEIAADDTSRRPGNAAHSGHNPDLPDPELVDSLIIWIGKNTDYNIAAARADPPRLSFSNVGEVIVYEGRSVMVADDLRGAYDLPGRHIYLVLPWYSGDPLDVARLLHEIAHDVQYSNRPWPCPARAEWEAYKLQEAWLAERGIPADFNWIWIHLRSRCRARPHP